MAAVVVIISRYDLSIKACCRNHPNKTKLLVYKPLLSLYKLFKQLHIVPVINNNCTYVSDKTEGVLQL